MNYYGRVIDEAFNGEYAYHCSYDGDVNMFNGKEEIYYNNTKVYECTFHGGLVK